MRYHGLDLLRGLAMLLGIVLHAMLLFQAPQLLPEVLPNTAATVPEPEAWTWGLTVWIHIWRMPLFFMLAGFFAELVIARKGLRAYVQDRAIRIGLTLLVFLSLLGLLLWRDPLTLDHLWFLWVLLIFIAVAAALRALGLRPVALSPWWFLGMTLALFLIAALFRQNAVWHHIPSHVSDLKWQTGALYVVYFASGLMMYHARAVLNVLARPRFHWPALAMGLALTLVLFATLSEAKAAQWLYPVSGIATWAWCLGLIGLAQAHVHSPRGWVRWLVEASYPVYIVHLYPTLLITALLIEAQVAQVWIVLVGSLGGWVLAVMLWYALIRYTPLDWVVNGFARAWWKWPFGRNGKY